MTLERPRPIVTTYPNGTRKLFCPCGAVLTWRTEPPTQCACCKRRYQWPAQSSGVGESERKEVSASLLASKSASTPTSELCVRTLDDLDDLRERQRSLVKAGPADYRGSDKDHYSTCARDDLTGVDGPEGGKVGCIASEVKAVTSPSPQPQRDGPDLTVVVPRAVAPRVIRVDDLPQQPAAPRPWIQHTTPRNSQVLTAATDVGQASGLGTRWPCRHGQDQIGGKRCIRCMASRDLTYVWRKPAGGSPGAFRYLCPGCLAEYARIGLVGESRTHVNAFSEATSGYGARVEVGL